MEGREVPDLRLIRGAIGLVTLLHGLAMAPHLTEFFSGAGILSVGELLHSIRPGWSLLYLDSSPTRVFILYGLFLTAAVTLGLGVCPRVSAALCYLLNLTFVRRFPPVDYGGFMFLRFAAFWLIFTRAEGPDAAGRRAGRAAGWISHLAIRMVQLEVCFIYLSAALLKLREPLWLNGSQMLEVLNIYGVMWNFTFLQRTPRLVALLTYGPMFAELFFPVLVWFRQTRRSCLIAMAILHAGIIATMNVTFLSETMLALLTCFVTPEDRRAIRSTLARVKTVAFPRKF